MDGSMWFVIALIAVPVYIFAFLGMVVWLSSMDSEVWWGDRVVGDFADRGEGRAFLAAALWPLTGVVWYLLNFAMVVTYIGLFMWRMLELLLVFLLFAASWMGNSFGRVFVRSRKV